MKKKIEKQGEENTKDTTKGKQKLIDEDEFDNNETETEEEIDTDSSQEPQEVETKGNKREIKEMQKENNVSQQKKTKVSTQGESSKRNERRMSTQEYIDTAPSFDLQISQYFRDDL